MESYDLVVIGGGPAGIQGAATARVLGRTVALVDRHHELGGAGANTGTVPSKTLRETAVVLAGLRSRDLYGVDLSVRRKITVADFLRHERKVKEGLNARFNQQLDACDTRVIFGDATFVDANTILIHGRSSDEACDPHKERAALDEDVMIRGDKILIATGSSPSRPGIFPFGPGVFDSDTLLNLGNLPNTMAVLGAGTIGCEYACTFAALGSKVHLIDGRDCLLPFLDRSIAEALTVEMERAGIVFRWKERATSCVVEDVPTPGHLGRVRLGFDSGESLVVEEVLVAAGRVSNTGSLNLEAAGVKLGERGLIPVDRSFRTNVPHIYAAGDVIGFPALASTSIEQAQRAVQHAFGRNPAPGTPDLLPHGLWTIPEIGFVGSTEEELRKQGIPYVAGLASYADNPRGRILGDAAGFLKLLFRLPDLELVGAHMIGEQATDVIHIGMIAMHAHLRADQFDDMCFNLPTLGELYKYAAFEAILEAERQGVDRPLPKAAPGSL
ncbi:FAD-dependent oxidoreductase [Aquisphaera insulae]|uniref:FAD-dependent oxidoreductase n=1 Tax=Aquisphaera insulae TaxID=2712864 RepID=UPI0013EBE173|nr:FAD-dependent oxidoreductase [Aquisphaera insulae]